MLTRVKCSAQQEDIYFQKELGLMKKMTHCLLGAKSRCQWRYSEFYWRTLTRAFFFWDRVSSCNLSNRPASASQILGLQAWATQLCSSSSPFLPFMFSNKFSPCSRLSTHSWFSGLSLPSSKMTRIFLHSPGSHIFSISTTKPYHILQAHFQPIFSQLWLPREGIIQSLWLLFKLGLVTITQQSHSQSLYFKKQV